MAILLNLVKVVNPGDTGDDYGCFMFHRETAYPFVLRTTVTVHATSDQTSTNTAATLSPYKRE